MSRARAVQIPVGHGGLRLSQNEQRAQASVCDSLILDLRAADAKRQRSWSEREGFGSCVDQQR